MIKLPMEECLTVTEDGKRMKLQLVHKMISFTGLHHISPTFQVTGPNVGLVINTVKRKMRNDRNASVDMQPMNREMLMMRVCLASGYL